MKSLGIENGIITHFYGGTEKYAYALLFGSVFIIIASYLLGSINGAALVSRCIYHDDIRTHGSKNAGATNMVRVFGAKAGVITTAIDIGKTVVAVLLGAFLDYMLLPYLAALFCLIGHAFPIFFEYKGGKGVLVTATALLVTAWPVFLVETAIWALVLLFTKYVSVASIISALMYPFILYRIDVLFRQTPGFDVIFAFIMACFVIFLHRANIKRLKDGNENKIGSGKNKDKKGE